MTTWRWIQADLVYAVHAYQLHEHGGAEGIRDRNGIEAALVRPQHLAHYEDPELADLAAAYCWGLLRAHGFVDGNKRTAWVVARTFMVDNGGTLEFDLTEATKVVLAAAAGDITEADLAEWFRAGFPRLRRGSPQR